MNEEPLKTLSLNEYPIPEKYYIHNLADKHCKDMIFYKITFVDIHSGPCLCCGFHGDSNHLKDYCKKVNDNWFNLELWYKEPNTFTVFKTTNLFVQSLQMCIKCVENWVGEKTVKQIKIERQLKEA